MQKHYPTTAAQKDVLSALGETAEHMDAANALFAAYGISVLAVRQGRSSVPSITFTAGGAFNRYGEGETWTTGDKSLTAVQLTAILPFVAASDQKQAQRMLEVATAKETTQAAPASTANLDEVRPEDVDWMDENVLTTHGLRFGIQDGAGVFYTAGGHATGARVSRAMVAQGATLLYAGRLQPSVYSTGTLDPATGDVPAQYEKRRAQNAAIRRAIWDEARHEVQRILEEQRP